MDLRRKSVSVGNRRKWTGNDESARPGVKPSVSEMAVDQGTRDPETSSVGRTLGKKCHRPAWKLANLAHTVMS